MILYCHASIRFVMVNTHTVKFLGSLLWSQLSSDLRNLPSLNSVSRTESVENKTPLALISTMIVAAIGFARHNRTLQSACC